MTSISYIRAGLLSAALLLTTAIASPAFAENLPEISPRQIASDVERVQNPQTGAYEYIAPSFDPFEQDRSMAGSASLRSVSAGTSIDGQPIRGGALLDISFYYNSSSNDPYDTRGYEDAVFMSGEYAPVTLRDNRILECNENIRNVVYYHEDYYRPSLYVNLYRPYRHYRGHYRYDGFRGARGYNYGRAYSGHRGFGSRSRNRDARRNARDRSRDGSANRDTDRARRTHREGRADSRREDRDSTSARTREDRRNARNNRRNHRDYRGDSREGAATTGTHHLQANEADRTNRRVRGRNGRSVRTGNGQAVNNGRGQTAGASTPRPAPRSESNAAARAQVAESRARAAEKSKNAPKRHSGRKDRNRTRSKVKSKSKVQSKARSKISNKVSRSSNRSKRGYSKLKLINIFPMASAFSRNIVRNVDVQCAREEMLSVHIPQERLEAARFDGLTVLVLDRAGDEIPVYVPPNYIEGFSKAAAGHVTPNVSYQEPGSTAPVTRGPVYQEPHSRTTTESAPCPVGTAKQPDGTCLQGGTSSYSGYPTR